MPKEIKSVHVFDNTQILVADHQGQQIGELQNPLILMWAEDAARQGFDVDGVIVVCNKYRLRIFKTEEGFNFEMI